MAAHSLTLVRQTLAEISNIESGKNLDHAWMMIKAALNAPGWDSTLSLELPMENSFYRLMDAIDEKNLPEVKRILETMKVAFEPSHQWFGSMEDVRAGMESFVRWGFPHYKKRLKQFWSGEFPHGDAKAPFYKKELTSAVV